MAKITKNNLQGTVGALLQDVTAGGDRGERYETKVDSNVVGDYVISVNYFAGEGQAEGNVIFRIGEDITFEVPFKAIAPIGPAGQFITPYKIGTLKVSEVNETLNATLVLDLPECENSFDVYAVWETSDLDIDLHVYEPNFKHVWFFNKIGDAGKLVRGHEGKEYGP